MDRGTPATVLWSSVGWGTVTLAVGAWGGSGLLTPCSALPAWPCPENSVCAPDGPGLIQCLCESPFHGYKCLREVSACGTEPWAVPWPDPQGLQGAVMLTPGPGQGTFPMLLFGGILGTATVSLSLLLWGTQRRKAKTP